MSEGCASDKDLQTVQKFCSWNQYVLITTAFAELKPTAAETKSGGREAMSLCLKLGGI